MTSSARALLICTILFLWSGCGRPRSQTQLTRVRIAVPNTPITYLPVHLTHELGYDREQGIEIITQDVSGGSKALQAMFGGSADVIAGVYEQAIQMAVEGRQVRSFLILLQRPGLVLAASPASARVIRTAKDLSGAVLGISTPGSASHNFLNYFLLLHRVPLAEVSVTSIGLGPSSEAALERGNVHAAVLAGSAATLAQRRIPKLTILADARTPEGTKLLFGAEEYPAHNLLAPTQWLRDNPAIARKLVSAVKKAVVWMREHTPEDIRARIPAERRSPDVEADLEALRATIPMLSPDGLISAQGADTVRKALALSVEKVRIATIDVSQTYTNEFAGASEP